MAKLVSSVCTFSCQQQHPHSRPRFLSNRDHFNQYHNHSHYHNVGCFPPMMMMKQQQLQKQKRMRTKTITSQFKCNSSKHALLKGLKEFMGFKFKLQVPMLSCEMSILGRVFAIFFIVHQAAAPFPSNDFDNWLVPPASAVLYSPNTKVPRTGEVALRKSIPANPAMKSIQDFLEDIYYLLRFPQRKPYGTMEGDVKSALQIATNEKDSILGSVPLDMKERGLQLYNFLIDGQGGLQFLIDSIKEKDPDKVSMNLTSSLDTIAQLELLQAPGLPYFLPEQYQQYPRLNGRATVEFTMEKGDNSMFSVSSGGGPQKTATIQVVLDGYSAPLTAGNFAKLVIDGAYNGLKLKNTEQAVISDNERDEVGFSLPVEIMPAGGFEPLYRTTLSVQDGELPVLPLSVYGSIAMAHNPISEDYSSPSQFFFYLYDKRNAGLGGLSFDEGQFSVFGYTTGGKEILPQLKTGDIIKSAKLVDGFEHLVLPSSST